MKRICQCGVNPPSLPLCFHARTNLHALTVRQLVLIGSAIGAVCHIYLH